jgi:predicted PurR-regulated permease PerM
MMQRQLSVRPEPDHRPYFRKTASRHNVIVHYRDFTFLVLGVGQTFPCPDDLGARVGDSRAPFTRTARAQVTAESGRSACNDCSCNSTVDSRDVHRPDLVQETSESIRLVASNLNATGFQKAVARYPLLGTVAGWLESRFDLNAELKRLGSLMASRASGLVGGSVWFLTQLIIALFTLFYFLRDRGKLLEFVRRLTPLSEQETDELFRRVSQTIYVFLYGNVIVKLVQGFLGGAMFWILGLPAPVLFGAAMALFAVLPVMGTSLVWGPAVIYLAINGSWVKALVLCLWGLLVVGLIDNFLYPMLVAGELRFHTLAVFFAVFGGLIMFGVAGVVLGPMILAVTVTLLEVWRVRAGSVDRASKLC